MLLNKLSSEKQAAYLNLLKKKATDQAQADIDKQLYDLQGRILLDVQVSKAELQALNLGLSDLELEDLVKKTTTVSLDTSTNRDHRSNFGKKLLAGFDDPEGILANKDYRENCELIVGAALEMPKGSVIALQQELHFHLNLATKTYLKVVKPALNGKEAEMSEAYKETLAAVNNHLMEVYAKALQKAFNKDHTEIDLAILNNELDKAREQITPLAHQILHQKSGKKPAYMLPQSNLKKQSMRQRLLQQLQMTCFTQIQRLI